jgi:hypothetical protein
MICRNTLFWRNVAEHSLLLVIVSAHSLVSFTFLHSDEFFQINLQLNGIFQQAARGEHCTQCVFVDELLDGNVQKEPQDFLPCPISRH